MGNWGTKHAAWPLPGSPEAQLRGSGRSSRYTDRSDERPIQDVIKVICFRVVGNGSQFKVVLADEYEGRDIRWFVAGGSFDHVEWHKYGVKSGGGKKHNRPKRVPTEWYGVTGVYDPPSTCVWAKLVNPFTDKVVACGGIDHLFSQVQEGDDGV